jgi:hypothetical protein
MFALRDTILLGGVRARHSMRHVGALKIPMKFVLLTTPIGQNDLDLSD